jgi:hypothetical protein
MFSKCDLRTQTRPYFLRKKRYAKHTFRSELGLAQPHRLGLLSPWSKAHMYGLSLSLTQQTSFFIYISGSASI